MRKYDYAAIALILFILTLFALMAFARSDSEFAKITFKDPTAFFTMILSIFTIILATTTILIWIDSRDNTQEQHQSNHEQANRTIRSLEIAVTATGISERVLIENIDSNQKNLRAYLSIHLSNLSIERAGVIRPIISAKSTIQNFGKTPAYNVLHQFVFFIETWPITILTNIPWPQRPEDQIRSIPPIAPNEVISAGGAHGIDYSLERMRNEGLRLYVASIANYCDIYGINRETRLLMSLVNSVEWLVGFEESTRLGMPGTIQVNLEGAQYGNIAT